MENGATVTEKENVSKVRLREVRSSIVGVLSFGMTIGQPRSSWIYEYGSYELSMRCSQGREKRKQMEKGRPEKWEENLQSCGLLKANDKCHQICHHC